MSWRDVLAPASQNPHNPHNYEPTGGSGDYGDTGERTPVRDGASPIRAAELREQAQGAGDWEALYAVLDTAQAAYDAGEVTQEEAESLAGYVADRSRHVPEDAGTDTLGELLQSQTVVRVRSRLLGETVVWLADGAEVPKDTAEVAYCEQELHQLEGQAPAMVRAVHATKRALDGRLLFHPEAGQEDGVTQPGGI